MYQEFFGFNRRPFPTHGAPSPLIPTPATDEALPALERCAREGRGIAILSAPPGTGKTAVALDIGRRLSDALHVVYLSSSNYTSRRGLLQAILFELGVGYAGLSEQEARLQVIESARNMLPGRQGIVLVVDEADQLSERLLDELRALANYMHEGRPLLRVVLCGQLALDERLAAPEMDAFNQRVGCHVVLESLDRKQSAAYIRATLTACGAEPEDVFATEALDLICVASDGNIRCLHHLCDHALLLAFVAEEKPVSAATVRAALEDLQGLPLAWHVPAASPPELTSDRSHESMTGPVEDAGGDEDNLAAAIPDAPEAGMPNETHAAPMAAEAETTVIEFGGDLELKPSPPDPKLDQVPDSPVSDADAGTVHSASREYRLEDRYAELDRLAELETGTAVAVQPDRGETAGKPLAAIPVPDPAARQTIEAELLAQIAEMRAEVQHVSSADDASDQPQPPALPTGVTSDAAEWDVVQPESAGEDLAQVVETGRQNEQVNVCETVDTSALATMPPPKFTEAPQPPPDSETSAEEHAGRVPHDRERIDEGSRRYAFLFTRLRNRRRDLAARSGH